MNIGRMPQSSVVRRVFNCTVISLLFLMACTLAAQAGSAARYKITARWPLTGEGGWSYIVCDSARHTLLVPRDDRLMVIDTQTGKTAGEISGLTDARDIALNSDGKVGYISDGISGTVRLFDRVSMQLTSSIVVGGTIDAIVFEPVTHSIFAFDTHNKTVAVIDAGSRSARATIRLPGRPAAAIADQKGAVLVNLVSSGELARIEAKTRTIAAVWSLSPCVGPGGLAMDPVRSMVFSVCENKTMAISDSASGKLVASVAIGEGAKSAAFDPGQGTVLSANGDGSLTVIGEEAASGFAVLQNLATQPGARTMALDSSNGRVYLVVARFGQRSGPTSEELQYRPTPVPGSAVILVIENQ